MLFDRLDGGAVHLRKVGAQDLSTNGKDPMVLPLSANNDRGICARCIARHDPEKDFGFCLHQLPFPAAARRPFPVADRP